MDAVSGPLFGGRVQCRTNPFCSGGGGARVLHGGLAMTTPGAEAPPASSEPTPGALLPLGMLGGVCGRQTLRFPF